MRTRLVSITVGQPLFIEEMLAMFADDPGVNQGAGAQLSVPEIDPSLPRLVSSATSGRAPLLQLLP